MVPGVMVVKSFDGKDYVYSVLKAEKSFDLKNATLQTGVSAQKSVNVSAPLMIQGTVRLTLK